MAGALRSRPARGRGPEVIFRSPGDRDRSCSRVRTAGPWGSGGWFRPPPAPRSGERRGGKGCARPIYTMAEALSVLPAVRLDGPAAEDIGHGRGVGVAPGGVARPGGDLPLAGGPRWVVLEVPDGGPRGLGGLVRAPAGA